MKLFLPSVLALTFLFVAPEANGQNKETWKIFNDAKQISDDILDTPVCIKATGNKNGEEFMYTNDFLKEYDIWYKNQGHFVWFAAWFHKSYRGLDDSVKPKYVFFTPPLDLQSNLPRSLDYYKEFKWKIIPVKKFGWDTFEIENYSTKQVLLIKGEMNRKTDPVHYQFNGRRFVFVENFYDHYHYDHSRMWKIREVENGTYIIKNSWSHEFLYRARLDINKVGSVSTVGQAAGNLALTWTNRNMIEEALLKIEKC